MRYTVFDVETPNSANNRMSAIGIVVLEDAQIVDRFYSLVQPDTHFDPFNMELTGITPEMVASAPNFARLWPQIRPFMEDAVLVAHNAQFDMAVLSKCLRAYGIEWKPMAEYICTCKMSGLCLPHLANHRLNTLCDYYRIPLDHHQADSDALACAKLLLWMAGQVDKNRFLRKYDLQTGRTLPAGRMIGRNGK